MDKHKVKNILIFVLIMLNIAVFTVYYKVDAQDKILYNQTKDNVSLILSSNNINIDKRIIPETPDFFSGRYIERALSANSSFIAKLLGSGWAQTDEYTFVSDSKTLKFSGNVFDFTDSAPDNPPKDFSETEIKNYCFEKMKELDIDYKSYKYNGLNFNGNNVKAIFSPVLSEYEFFDSFISFEISSPGTTAIQGKNVLLTRSVPSIATKLYDINSVLLDLASLDKMKDVKATSVISIKLGFYIGSGEDRYSNVLAIPTWQIATENGFIFYFDARNGKYIE